MKKRVAVLTRGDFTAASAHPLKDSQKWIVKRSHIESIICPSYETVKSPILVFSFGSMRGCILNIFIRVIDSKILMMILSEY